MLNRRSFLCVDDGALFHGIFPFFVMMRRRGMCFATIMLLQFVAVVVVVKGTNRRGLLLYIFWS